MNDKGHRPGYESAQIASELFNKDARIAELETVLAGARLAAG
jgi:hypothetical protein